MKEGFSWEKTLPIITACLCMVVLLLNHIIRGVEVDGTFVTLLAGIFASSAGAAIISAKKKLDINDEVKNGEKKGGKDGGTDATNK